MTKLIKLEFTVALQQSTSLVDFEGQLGDLIDEIPYSFNGKTRVLKMIIEDYNE